jgi:CheY-like chemotaxis protein
MEEPKTRTKRILLASPDGTLLDRLSRVLQEVNYAVASTQRSGRLLFRALEDPFDLVIMDLDLEDLEGIEALQILRRAKPDLPVIVITGDLRERESRQLLGEGVAGHLRKPIGIADLREAVRLASEIK